MKRRYAAAGMVVVLLAAPILLAHSQATYAPYIWEAMWALPNPAPSQNELDVRNELAREVAQFMDWAQQTNPPRPPGPYYLAQGYQSEDFYWLNPGETVLALSQALEFLEPPLRDRVIDYLKYILTMPAISPLSFDIPTTGSHALLNPSHYRQYYTPLPDELSPNRANVRSSEFGPRPENLYAVWAFAHFVSRFEAPGGQRAWDIVNANWAYVQALYNQLPATPLTYWDIMAYVGYARLAKQLGRPYAAAESRAQAGYAAGLNFTQFYRNMSSSRFCWGNQGLSGWVGIWDYCLFSAIDPTYLAGGYNPFNHSGYAGQSLTNKTSMFAPEIGRFLHDRVQSSVLDDPGYGLYRFTAPGGAFYFPLWWETKGEKPWAIRDANTPEDGNGENAILHPSFGWQMFLLKAYVEGAGLSPARADAMKSYLDTPWTLGDVFYIEKLITVLRMYSTIVWSDKPVIRSSKSGYPGGPRQSEILTYVIAVAGSGRPTTVVDTLPAPVDYVSHSTSCPGSSAYNTATRQVTYSGTTSFLTPCAMTIQTRVVTDQIMIVTNTAAIDNGLNTPESVSAVVILNPYNAYLPLIRK